MTGRSNGCGLCPWSCSGKGGAYSYLRKSCYNSYALLYSGDNIIVTNFVIIVKSSQTTKTMLITIYMAIITTCMKMELILYHKNHYQIHVRKWTTFGLTNQTRHRPCMFVATL
jgi:hypothetical protein